MPADPADFGNYFDDFTIGDVYKHPLGRTITEADNTWFTLLTMNTNPNHFDANLAEHTEFGKPLVNSGLTLAIVLGQSVYDISQNAFANLGWENITLSAPVFVGDTVYSESKVIGLRESASRPYAGIVTVLTRGYTQEGTVFMTFERSVYVYKRDDAPTGAAFPEVSEDWPT
ncbi:MAG: MaoC family dehydratase [Acidimicrobiia bacterium]